MFESILEFANQSASISQVLPPLIRWSISLVIAIAFSIPIMFAAWLLLWTASPAIGSLIERIKVWQRAASEAASGLSDKAAEAFKGLTANETFVPLSVPLEYTKPAELDSLHNATRELANLLKRSPNLKDHDALEKAKAANELTAAIKDLSASQSLVRTPEIPKISQDDAIAKFKKKQALTALVIFAPLSLIAVIFNTALLDVFFSGLFGRREVLGVPYSILMSLAFSLFEIGAGCILAYVGTGDQEEDRIGTVVLCRAVILCLLLIESALYFLIADNYFRFTSPPLEMIQDGQLLTVFLEGAWFTLIGPAIVLSLYLLGHLSAESYFKYTRFAVLDDFRKSLETAHQLSQKYIKDISVGDQRVEEIKVKLNRLDIDREERTDELPGLLAKYTKELQEKIKLCEEAAHRLQTSQIKPPSQNAMLVASEQSTQLLKSGGVYLVVLILSALLGMWALPIEQISIVPNNAAGQLVVSLFICMFCLIGGYSLSTRLSVLNQQSETDIEFITTERTAQTVAVMTTTFILTCVFYIFIFKDAENAAPRALLVILANIASVYVGTKFAPYMPVWTAICAASLWIILSAGARMAQVLIFIGALICESLQALLRLMAKPAQTLVQRSRLDVDH